MFYRRIGGELGFHSLGRTYQQRCHTFFAVIFIGAPEVLHATGLNGTEILGFGGSEGGIFVAVIRY